MKYVYIIRSVLKAQHRYIGITDDLKARLKLHNAGGCPHTSNFRPWCVETYVAFSDSAKAIKFEKYLKTGAGWAFSLKRF